MSGSSNSLGGNSSGVSGNNSRTGSPRRGVDRDMFDSTGFYVGWLDGDGASNPLGEEDGAAETVARGKRRTSRQRQAKAAAEAEADAAATDTWGGGIGTEYLVSWANGLPGATTTSSASTASANNGNSPHMEASGDTAHNNNNNFASTYGGQAPLAPADTSARGRPSMVRVGSTSVSLNYLSALADADKDGEMDQQGSG